MMRSITVLAGREFASQLRSGTLILVGVVAPVLLALLFGFALGGSDTTEPSRVGVVDLDGGEFASSMQDEVLASEELSDIITLEEVGTVSEAQGAVDSGELGSAIVFTEGFTETVRAGEGGVVEVLESASNPVAAVVATSVVDQMSALVQARTLSVRTATAAGVPTSEVQEFVEANGADGPSLSLVDAAMADGAVDMSVFYASGIAALFAFLVVGTAARSLLLDRRIGVLARVQASPVPGWALVFSKAIVGFAAALLSMCSTWVASVLIFGQSWGYPPAVFLLFAAHCLAATALTMLVATGARTDAQADGYVLVLSFTFGFLGGSLIPIFQLPDALQVLSRFTPNGWTANGLGSLVVSGGGIDSILLPVAVLLAIAAVGGLAAGLRFRKGLLR